DSDRLRQILLNLIGNAMKFTEHGEVGVGIKADPALEHGLHFTVCDTGIGIPADLQRLIFEAFTQGDGSLGPRQGGTGLGLAICSRLVRLMGGRIWVESNPGVGSSFHFTARLRKHEAAAQPDPAAEVAAALPSASIPRPPSRILPVEDNPVNQMLATRAI